jgi:hypothetical protein
VVLGLGLECSKGREWHVSRIAVTHTKTKAGDTKTSTLDTKANTRRTPKPVHETPKPTSGLSNHP